MARRTIFANFEDTGMCMLDKDEAHHLTRVLRARGGDTVFILDGKGRRAQSTLIEDRKNVALRVDRVAVVAPPACRIWLGQAVPQGGAFEDIIRCATELGVERIVPLVTERTEGRVALTPAKLSRWRVIAAEACKQSWNAYLPHIDAPTALEVFLKNLPNDSTRCVASLETNARPLAHDTYRHVVWLVGPEGDFSANEHKLIEKYCFCATKLTSNILRSSTAALYALSVTRYLGAG